MASAMADGIGRVDFYFEDWLSGTFELTPELRGALITVCSLIWKTGNRLKDEDEKLAHWCVVSTRRWRALRAGLIEAGKIVIEDGFIRQKRAVQEFQNVKHRVDVARASGSKGGRKRAENAANQPRTRDELEANPQKNKGSASSGSQAITITITKDKNPSPDGEGVDPKGTDPIPKLPALVPEDRQFLIDAAVIWNRVAEGGLSKAEKLTRERKARLRKRLAKDCNGVLDEWEAYCRRLRASAFCCGENDRGWRADLDFALLPKTFVQTIEGKYDDRPRQQPRGSPSNGHARRRGSVMESLRTNLDLMDDPDDASDPQSLSGLPQPFALVL
jgi:uncharacterized protein YdaU (DUF1376 family)